MTNIELIKFLIKNDILKEYKILPFSNELLCLCPFHEEKKPSFGINLITGKYNCFSCGEAGLNFSSFFKKITKIYDINFEHIEENKISLLNNELQLLKLKNQKKEKIFFNPIIFKYFNDNLGDWIKLRINNKKIIELFEIKYNKEKNQYLIPIRNEFEEIVGYVIRQFKKPKYLYNTGLSKKEILFGLDKCKGSTGIITEGPFDVIKTFDNDCKNCIGILGAKMSKEQEKLILQYYNTIIIATDNDKAGKDCMKDIYNRLKGKIKVYKFSWVTNKKDLGELTKKELKLELNHLIGGS